MSLTLGSFLSAGSLNGTVAVVRKRLGRRCAGRRAEGRTFNARVRDAIVAEAPALTNGRLMKEIEKMKNNTAAQLFYKLHDYRLYSRQRRWRGITNGREGSRSPHSGGATVQPPEKTGEKWNS